MNTRSGPTLVLGLALGSSISVHSLWLFGATAAGLVALGLVLRYIAQHDDFLGAYDFGGVVISLVMAFAYAPLLIVQWLTGKANSEHNVLNNRQVLALEKIASHFSDLQTASGAKSASPSSRYQ